VTTLAVLDEEQPATARPGGRLSHWARNNIPTVVMLLIAAVLVIPPVIMLLISALTEVSPDGRSRAFGFENFIKILTDPITYQTLGNTLIFSVFAALLTTVLATALAWLVERTNAPLRRAVYVLMILSFAVPVFVQGMGWMLFLGPNNGLVTSISRLIFGPDAPTFPLYTMGSMVFIQALTLLPAIFLLIAPVVRSANPAHEEAASVSGATRSQVMRKVTLPLMLPGIGAALFLSFIIAVDAFEVPALVGTPSRIIVLSTEIYSKVRTAFPDYEAASAFAILLMLLTIVGLAFYQRATAAAQKYATVTGKGFRATRMDLGRWRWAGAAVCLIVSLLVIAPVVMVVWASFLGTYEAPSMDALSRVSFDTYARVLQNESVTGALLNSLLLGLTCAIATVILTGAAAWFLVRRRSFASRSVDLLLTLPLVIPGIVLSLAMLRTYINVPLPIYGTQAIVLIALVVHYAPYGMRYAHAGMVSLHPELEEAALVSGASRFTVARRILVPLLLPSLFAASAFIFLATIRQLSLVLFLAGPGNQLAAPLMFRLWGQGSLTEASALAVIVVLAACTLLLIANRLTAGKAIQGSR
jgi:iron(III) transport system permease protein